MSELMYVAFGGIMILAILVMGIGVAVNAALLLKGASRFSKMMTKESHRYGDHFEREQRRSINQQDENDDLEEERIGRMVGARIDTVEDGDAFAISEADFNRAFGGDNHAEDGLERIMAFC